MKTTHCIEHFGSKADLAKALGIAPPSVYEWGEFPPDLRQLQVEALTAGKLRAEPGCDKFRIPRKRAAA
jgi:hypothetical protein